MGAALLTACSASGTPTASGGTTTTASSTTTVATGSADAAGTVWLCRPGLADDPCTANLTATAVRADGKRSVQHAAPASNPPIDCFYVYPTVSAQKTENANLRVDPAETAVAVAQASRFSQVCRVYAPMYRQLTLQAIAGHITARGATTAYLSVLAAWRDYLAHFNHGRGVVLIGHSQGSSLLIPLIRNQIDNDPAQRARLVSALLMGGNVTVPVGKSVGGDFQHVAACRATDQVGCVVAYSSFSSMPPPDSFFGRVGVSVANPSGSTITAASHLQVLCTNPAALGGGTGSLEPYFPAASQPTAGVSTPWVTFPDHYTATCEDRGGASWLQIDTTAVAGDHRPVVTQSLGPRWGLHLVDVNLALGNLVQLVRQQAAAYGQR